MNEGAVAAFQAAPLARLYPGRWPGLRNSRAVGAEKFANSRARPDHGQFERNSHEPIVARCAFGQERIPGRVVRQTTKRHAHRMSPCDAAPSFKFARRTFLRRNSAI